MYKLTFYVPITSLEDVKEACFQAGGGQYDDYHRCCWQVLGQGQFEPLENSQPFIGEQNKLEKVEEYRVEMIVENARAKQVVECLLRSHPYEEVAYSLVLITLLADLF